MCAKALNHSAHSKERTMPDAARFRKFLVAARLTIGFAVLVMPRTFAKILGINPGENRALPYVGRLFGIREALMAYQLYQASDDELEEILRQGILVDGIDATAGFAALLRGEISARTFLMVTVTAGGALASGIMSRQPQPTT